MKSTLTNTQFWIGAAVGFFVLPYASKFIRAQAEKLRGVTMAA